jgi:hypothetical protein
LVGDELPERRVAPGGVQPGDVERLLDRHRHAVERPHRLAARNGLVGGGRLLQGRLTHQFDDCIQGCVDGIDPAKDQFGQLAGADLFVADHRGRGGGRLGERLFHGPRCTTRHRQRPTGWPAALAALGRRHQAHATEPTTSGKPPRQP